MTADQAKKIGFFGIPGDDAAKAGATVWEPGGAYIPKASKNIDLAKKFIAFMNTKAGTDAFSTGTPPTGPYLVKGLTLPASAPPVAADLQAYITSKAFSPALEFLSPVKGPSLEQITRRRRVRTDRPPAGRRPVRPGRRQAGQAVGPAGLVTESRPSEARAVGLRDDRGARPGRPAAHRGPAAGAAPSAHTYSSTVLPPRRHHLPVIFVVPTVMSFYFAFTRWTLFDAKFIGLDNFRQFFSEQALRSGLWHTVVYAVVTSGLKVVLGMLLAVLLTSQHPGHAACCGRSSSSRSWSAPSRSASPSAC